MTIVCYSNGALKMYIKFESLKLNTWDELLSLFRVFTILTHMIGFASFQMFQSCHFCTSVAIVSTFEKADFLLEVI